MVVAGGGNVARGMRCPSDAIDAGTVIGQPSDRSARNADVQDDYLKNGKDEGVEEDDDFLR